MEPMMPTSFIPKRPVSTEPVPVARSGSHTVGLLSLLAVVIVIATGVSYAGVHFYQKTLVAQKVKVDAQINEARKGIGTDFLGDMKRLDARISGVKQTIDNHIVVSPIFAALEQTTLRSVQYKTFSYAFTTDPASKATVVQVTLTGAAKSYATIALQSDSFTQNNLIKNPVFSNLTVDDKTSGVNFKLVFTVNPASLSYESFIAGVSKQQTL
jgi:hypothetical protein